MERADMTERTCPHCGDPMPNPRRVQCGKPACRAAWQRERVRDYQRKRSAAGHKREHWTCERTCIECSAVFASTKPDAKYCSTGKDSCEAKAKRGVNLKTGEPARVRIKRTPIALVGDRACDAYKEALLADGCVYCGGPASGMDHIQPRNTGGDDGWDNWTPCCKDCNGQKGTLPLLAYLLWRQVYPKHKELREEIRSIHTMRPDPGVAGGLKAA
jgi:hypothetical protein